MGHPSSRALPHVGQAGGPGVPQHLLPLLRGVNPSGMKKTVSETGQTCQVHAVAFSWCFHVARQLFCGCVWSDGGYWKILLITLKDSQKKLRGDKSHKMRTAASEQG